ncbi:MAG: site-specific DNA-methyltransferase [Endomicrobium sp.]|jgi:site-specific DNA-methyltransferase (adenine-specific)|nr:site-specific DNA-methyltransferase [Endomicrobium sp.]
MQLNRETCHLSPTNEVFERNNFINKIVYGDSLYILKNIPDETVDLIITSPPYFQQRDYGNGGCGIGNEETEDQYLDNLMEIFYASVRVTKKTGAIVFNVGDKYLNGALALLPYKFAIRATESKEVFLINQITWSKLNPTPRQGKRKLIQATEPFFIFVRSKDYYFNLDNYLKHLDGLNKKLNSKSSSKLGKKYFKIIENSKLTNLERQNAKKALEKAILSVQKGEIESFRMKIKGIHKEAYGGMSGGRNNQIRKNGFTIIKILGNALKKDLIESPVEVTKKNRHPAVYPLYIVQELIKLLSKEGNLILDPFCGSGTTCIAAKKLNRKYLGIEINSEYVKLSEERLKKTDFQQEFYI